MEIKIKEIKCCAECEFVGKEAYNGSHIWCEHPKANGINLPNRDLVIHPDCPIMTFTIVKHVAGEYAKNVTGYIRVTS